MTEAEWLASDSPSAMLWGSSRPTSVRKTRLWLCGCCYRIWHLVTDGRSRRGVEVAERYADGLATSTELADAHRDAANACSETYERWERDIRAVGGDEGEGYVHEGCDEFTGATGICEGVSEPEFTGNSSPHNISCEAVHAVAYAVDPQPYEVIISHQNAARRSAIDQENAAQAVLFRDIFGNPFRPVAFSPEWRTDTVIALARQMYEAREFGAMPILADALQDAGCDSDDILNHCRGDGPHVRGCWVVDLVLGKE